MKKILGILTLFVTLFSFAQDEEFYYKNYDWKEKPETFQLTQEETAKDQVVLTEKKYFHFLQKGENFVKYTLEHKIIRLNTDKAIENNNKFYVSNYGSLEVITQKARVIRPNGKIIELSVKDIKTAMDENGNPEYQYFAFEGIEIGSYIEYFHVMIFPAEYKGTEVKVQNMNIKHHVEHEIICPTRLEFKIKSINGLKDFLQDTVITDFNRYYMHTDFVDGIEEEASSSYGANVQKYYYMLYKNNSTGKSNLINYQDVTKNIHASMFSPLTSKEQKAINKYIKASGASNETTVINKVRKLENYIKSTIGISSDYFENCRVISYILKNKISDEDGAMKLMLNCLRTLDIKFELVVTCDRTEKRFITDFQGYNFLDKFLIYINDIDKLYSADITSRVGFPSTEYIHTEGLFIKEIKVGEVTSSIGAVKKINGSEMKESVDQIITFVKINDDKSSTNVKIERTTTGYKAFYQSLMDYVEDAQKKEIKDEYINYIDNEIKPENVSFQNDSSKYYGVKPFIGKGELNSPNFIEIAGDKVLFKIGQLIGPQSNLYNSKTRKLPVETEHLRIYDRTINFEIPEGYKIKNINDLNMKITPTYDNNAIGFISTYEINGNMLIVHVKEWYNTVLVPVSDYKSYEDVVNAAADFNKLVIVLEKK
ncbi:MAG: DUF3857 domain-containing protein [Flavobacteriia bacterium]|nr:DUF3857 domain-containing protein [Flavobacteriia bacterium]